MLNWIFNRSSGMIAFILLKFINTVGPRSVASNAVKVKLNPQHGVQAALEQNQQSTGKCDSCDRVLQSVVNSTIEIEIAAF